MKKLIIAAPILSGILWGSTGLFVRSLAGMGMNSLTIMFSRVFLAMFMLLIGILLYDRSLLKIKIRDLWIFIAAGLIGTLGLNFCYNESISRLTLSLSAVLLSLAPVFVLLMAAVFFKEKITVKKFGCMILAIFGCALVSGIFEETSAMQWSALGLFIGVLSGFFYALYSIFSRIAIERGYHALTITFYCIFLIAAVLVPFADWNSIGHVLALNPAKNGILMFLHSLFASVLPYVLYTLSLNYMETGKASILASAEPVAAMLFGLFFFSEIPTPLSLAGLALTITALALLSLPDKNTAAADACEAGSPHEMPSAADVEKTDIEQKPE